MSKLFSLTLIALAGGGLLLASPSTSHAQVPVGVHVGVGPVAVTAGAYVPPVYPAYPAYPVYVRPRVVYQPIYPPVYAPAPAVVVGGPYWHRHHHYYRGWRR